LAATLLQRPGQFGVARVDKYHRHAI